MRDKEDKPGDLDLFRRAMNDIVPLKSAPRVAPVRPKPEPVPMMRERDERRVMEKLLEEPEFGDELETGEELLFLRPGYQRRYLQRLRRGQYSILDHLDLHNMNEATAGAALIDFIDRCAREGLGCVRIVHGKGLRSKVRPKLKLMTNRLLRKHRAVVAFASCRPVDGGTGAVAVLLKRP